MDIIIPDPNSQWYYKKVDKLVIICCDQIKDGILTSASLDCLKECGNEFDSIHIHGANSTDLEDVLKFNLSAIGCVRDRLKTLIIENCDLTLEGQAFTAESVPKENEIFPNLETVELSTCRISEFDQRRFYMKHPKVTLFAQDRCSGDTVDIANIKNPYNPAIKFVGYRFVKAANSGITSLAPFSELTTLEVLDITNCPIETLDELSSSVSMKKIIATGSKLRTFNGPWNFRFLNELWADNTQVESDKGLSRFPDLEVLKISGTKIRTLGEIEKSPMYELHLGGPLEASCVGVVTKLKRMMYLHLNGTPIDQEFIKMLPNNPMKIYINGQENVLVDNYQKAVHEQRDCYNDERKVMMEEIDSLRKARNEQLAELQTLRRRDMQREQEQAQMRLEHIELAQTSAEQQKSMDEMSQQMNKLFQTDQLDALRPDKTQ